MAILSADPIFDDLEDRLADQMPLGVGAARDTVKSYVSGAFDIAASKPYNALLQLNTALFIIHTYMTERSMSHEDLGIDLKTFEEMRLLKYELGFA